jgi:hypothetical protein
MHKQAGAHVIPEMAETGNAPESVLAANITRGDLQAGNPRMASETAHPNDEEDKPGPATLPNALWLVGIGICYILTIRKTRHNTT